MTEPIKQADLYKDGLCNCKFELKGKHLTFNKQLHSSNHFTIYMCIRCNKPVYWQSAPYR